MAGATLLSSAASQARTTISINSGWDFMLADLPLEKLTEADSGWTQVSVPHTWNSRDAFDETPGYKRGVGWYRKQLMLKPLPGKNYFLKFEAANQTAEVYINGQLAGKHIGGYTAFTIDITPFLRERGGNNLLVRVDNRHDSAIAPLKGDFNFYGGIYRDVWLLELNAVHFDFGEYSSSGIKITTPNVSAESASVQISASLKNESGEPQTISILNKLLDPRGKVIAVEESLVNLQGGKASALHTMEKIPSPNLWHPDHPHIYTLVSEILSSDNKLLDRITTSVGFRWFRFDAEKGFFLNGKPLKLLGVNRHQDYLGLGNALSNERHIADIALAKQMGSNFLRTAHYPQDPAVLEACDRLGLLVSMEIPLDHEITDSAAFYENSENMQREMIRQYFNHPSIIVWAYMNEMLLGRNWEKDKADILKITDFARTLEKITREEDPTRYTMIPNHGDLELYQKAGLTDIPMIVGWNLYYGWYVEGFEGLGEFLDRHRRALPDKPLIITEYGAGADPRIRSQNPRRFDSSVEWQTRFFQKSLEQITERPFVAGAAVWNLVDFGSEARNDAVPKVNSKGLMTLDRQPKDAYYLLQAWLKDDPIIHIGSKNWDHRSGRASTEDPDKSFQTVEVYGNTGSAVLMVNGRPLGVKAFDKHIARWDVPFRDGRNLLQARAVADGICYEDVALIDFNVRSAAKPGQPFDDIYINAGADFYFTDAENDILWLPDSAYEKGFSGFDGGRPYMPRDLGFGIAANILGTDRDPLFQTQRRAIKAYVFDAPPGEYELILLFAALDQGDAPSVFSLAVNGEVVLEKLDLRRAFGTRKAVEKRVRIINSDSRLTVEFRPIKGEAAVNAVGLRKID